VIGRSSLACRHAEIDAQGGRSGGREMTQRYAVIFEQAQGNWAAYVPDLPGCITTGATLEETERNIREAIEGHLRVMREFGEPVPRPTSLARDQDHARQLGARNLRWPPALSIVAWRPALRERPRRCARTSPFSVNARRNAGVSRGWLSSFEPPAQRLLRLTGPTTCQ
jgi:predicted RNase H-like HicB family nuclease